MTNEENAQRLERISEVLELVCNPGRDHYEMIAEDVLAHAERHESFTAVDVESLADRIGERYRRASERFPVADVDLSDPDEFAAVKPVRVCLSDDEEEIDPASQQKLSEGTIAADKLAEEDRQYQNVKPADVQL